MIEIPYYDADGQAKQALEVDETRFGEQVRLRLLKEAVLMYEANKRQGTSSTKTRGEVAGTNAKPWRQKGTGRARAGTAQSPLWRGGGVIHGPRPRHFGWTMPKKKRRMALDSAILAKLQDGEVLCVESIAHEAPKTRVAAKLLEAVGVEGKCLVGLERHDEVVFKSFRNIPGAQVADIRNLNAHQVIGGGKLLLTRAALDQLLESRAGGGKAAPTQNEAPAAEEGGEKEAE